MSTLLAATLIGARTLTPSVRALTFAPSRPIAFEPGQWISVRAKNEALPIDRRSPLEPFVARSYSIASAPREDGTFELAVTRIEGGALSGWMHALAIGEVVEIAEPRGFFVLEPFERPIAFVATGTGLTPFRSMLEALHRRGPLAHAVTVLLGVRTEAELLYRDALEAIARADSKLRFMPVLSRGSDDWSGRRGYVQAHLEEALDGLAPRAGGDGERDVDVYVCGLTRMIKEVRKMAREELGVRKDRVHVERYD